MTCKHCGTDIAANALICYKCGTATVAPRIAPPANTSLLARPRGSRMGLVVAGVLVAVVLAGLSLWWWM